VFRVVDVERFDSVRKYEVGEVGESNMQVPISLVICGFLLCEVPSFYFFFFPSNISQYFIPPNSQITIS